MLINVNVFLELVYVSFTDRVRCSDPWVIYVCSDVINEHERVCREHAYGIYNTVLIHS
jgi:hypothetical protein